MSSMPFGAASCWPSMVRFNMSVGRVIPGSALRVARCALVTVQTTRNAKRVTRNSSSPLLERTRAAGDVALVFGAVLLDGGDDGTGGEVAQRAEHLAADLARQ